MVVADGLRGGGNAITKHHHFRELNRRIWGDFGDHFSIAELKK